ncbi:uncharacterized protein [Miscanthus floridulus]|uniref:uncharacterized protein n=1 Tax=Miscanthus floridulus TaxID=154761 RepID=UPI00345A8022
MGSTVEVERVTVGATPSSPRRVGEAPGSDGGQLALVDTEAALLPPPLPLQRRLAVSKRLHPRSRQTLLVGDPPLAPRKALKVNVSSSAHQAAEAQAGVRRGAAPGEAVSEETAAQEKEEQVEEEEPMPRDVVGLGAEAGASAVAEATEGEAGAPETSDVRAVDAEAIGVAVAEARAPGSVETEAMESEHQATKVALSEATKAAEASRVEVSAWKSKAEGLEKEASQAAEASVAAQAALDVEVREHEALRSAVRTACEALGVEEVQSASSLGSRLIALSGHVRERLRGALHTGVKRALAVVSSHYAINLEAVSDGYVLPEDDEEADAEEFRQHSSR